MTPPRHTLSLADVARLAHVHRPVVSMWRKRELDGFPFPSPNAEGRFLHGEVAEWLTQTGRGNNPYAKADLALYAATSATSNPEECSGLRDLLAARVLTDVPLSTFDLDDLIDAIDEIDPDDEFLFSEVEALDITAYPELAADADAVADAAWHPREGYERLLDAQARVGHTPDDRIGPELAALLVDACRSLLGPDSVLVDVAATATDVVITLCADEDLPAPRVCLPTASEERACCRRYRVHGIVPDRAKLDDEWGLTPGSVAVLRLPNDPRAAFDLLGEVEVQLADRAYALVVGPAGILTDALPPDEELLRDQFLRNNTLRAAVRLPQGLTRAASRQHLGLWVMSRAEDDTPIWVGDLAGQPFDVSTLQGLMDDLLAVASRQHGRAYAILDRVSRQELISRRGSLVVLDRPIVPRPADSADDAATLTEIRDALANTGLDPFPYSVRAHHRRRGLAVTLGEAVRRGDVTLISGTRLTEHPTGTTPMWSAEAVADKTPEAIDLLRFSAAHPKAALTSEGDVVFTNNAKPAAVVDWAGGSAVSYPARILRVGPGPFNPSAIAHAINRVPAGHSKWRTWQIPVTQMDPASADEILRTLDNYEADLRRRQVQLNELRQLVSRSVLSGAIELSTTSADDMEGR